MGLFVRSHFGSSYWQGHLVTSSAMERLLEGQRPTTGASSSMDTPLEAQRPTTGPRRLLSMEHREQRLVHVACAWAMHHRQEALVHPPSPLAMEQRQQAHVRLPCPWAMEYRQQSRRQVVRIAMRIACLSRTSCWPWILWKSSWRQLESVMQGRSRQLESALKRSSRQLESVLALALHARQVLHRSQG